MRRFLPLAVAFSMMAVTGEDQSDSALSDPQSATASVAPAPSAGDSAGAEFDAGDARLRDAPNA